ncbi:DUF4421 family protein [Flavicella sp.]|uniref:DUF4421 family protein n=1 Tax=Flavicella sp. TaxID=2957742 RepID=UPI00263677EA|nr:DUF4421 family protein [Flavicella sp.]MDG1803667.1 DUF4421 family protein [Flavicella sp.]
MMLHNKKGFIFLIPFLTIVVNCFGQIDSTSVIVEDGYIEKMRDKLAIENSFNNEYEIFKVKTNGVTYEISPNIRTNYRIQLNYKFILAGFQFAPKLFPNNDDNESKGKTKSFNLKIKFVLTHWFATLQYSNIQGYYLKNSSDFTNISENNFIQFPDLHYTAYEIETGFIQNSKFSYRSITSHMERQLKSTGSFIPVLKVRNYMLDDQSANINTQKSNNLEFTIGPGYAYNFVLKENFYTSVGALVSIGNIHTKLTTRSANDNSITYQNNLLTQWQGKLGLGYNGKKFYSGLFATVSDTNYKQQHTTATNTETRVFYNLFFGIRINSPKFLKRNVTKIEDKLSL